MKKLLWIVLLSFPLILAACSQSKEDNDEYLGVIGGGEAFDYSYLTLKEKEGFTWEIGYKGETSFFKETAVNEDDLLSFMDAVNSAKAQFWELLVSLIYLAIVAFLTLFLYLKNKNLLRESVIVMAVFTGFGIWNAVDVSFDLNLSLVALETSFRVLTI
ncbi:hypothetical protein [Bacillus sp. P14.5]|uniref:hypothetical protein n=1 Tax=Bacillus sp. P14.5 TaxID=1983400 RepID=UPI000DEA3766|nr:hypothetical protein [Bacillus sp. P14.5]